LLLQDKSVQNPDLLAIVFRLLGFLAPKDFNIIWLSNILVLSVPDEG
jgi:hypothetical protein